MAGEGVDSGTRYHGADAGLRGARFLRFGDFQIDLLRRRLTRAGRRLDIQRKPLDVLVHLASRPGEVVSRQQLIDAHWDGVVHDEALTRCIGVVRRTLSESTDSPQYVETVWGEGYRFIAPVSAVAMQRPGEQEATPMSGAEPIQNARRSWWRKAANRYVLIAVAILLITLAAVAWRLSGPPQSSPAGRIAVLPMAWEQAGDEWLAHALTDQLVQTIARIEGVTVVSQLTGDEPGIGSPVEVGRRLGVDSVLTSRLTRSSEGFGVSAQLITLEDGVVGWSYALPPTSTEADPKLVDQIVGSVARSLWADLHVPRPEPRIDPKAYQQYLLARFYWHQRTEPGLRAAIEAYRAALRIDPDYAEARVGLAESWLLLPLYGAVAPREAIPRAREAASRALSIDPHQARAFGVLGIIAMQYDWNWPRAEALLRRAQTLQPNDATTEQWLGELYCYLRRFAECRQHLRIAQGLEPLSPVLRTLQASTALWAGDYADAVAAYGVALQELPGFPLALYALGMSYTGLGAWTDAAAHYRAAEPGIGFAVTGGPLVFATARAGNADQAAELLERLEALARERYVPPSKFTIAWLGLGDHARALDWLKRAVTAHDDRLVYLAVDPHYRELYADPEFRAILAAVGLADALPNP